MPAGSIPKHEGAQVGALPLVITGPTVLEGGGVSASGAAAFDLSGSTGPFLTSRGAVTLGPGNVSITGDVIGIVTLDAGATIQQTQGPNPGEIMPLEWIQNDAAKSPWGIQLQNFLFNSTEDGVTHYGYNPFNVDNRNGAWQAIYSIEQDWESSPGTHVTEMYWAFADKAGSFGSPWAQARPVYATWDRGTTQVAVNITGTGTGGHVAITGTDYVAINATGAAPSNVTVESGFGTIIMQGQTFRYIDASGQGIMDMTSSNPTGIGGPGFAIIACTTSSLPNNAIQFRTQTLAAKAADGSNTYPTQNSAVAGGATALPLTPAGYMDFGLNGVLVSIPYYTHV